MIFDEVVRVEIDQQASEMPVKSNRKSIKRGRVRVHFDTSSKLGELSQKRAVAKAKKSKQDDEWELLYDQQLVIEPPYNSTAIAELFDNSDVLESAIGAMETNTASFGFQLIPLEGLEVDDTDKVLVEKIKKERTRLTNWFRFASANSTSWTDLLKKTRVDLELFGDGYWEIIRDTAGRLAQIEHMRARFMRKGKLDNADEEVEVEQWYLDEHNQWKKRKVSRRFRRYVQRLNGRYIWFKEFGDPRRIRADDGKIDENAKDEDLANEVICFSRYSPTSIYGRPCWRGAATEIAGRTAASEVNFNLFDNNGIPRLAVLVSGATLSKGGVDRVNEFFKQVKGRENFNTPLIIEATADHDPMDKSGGPQTRVELKNLSDVMQSDAAFEKYSGNAAKNVGMCFRLPPLFLGLSQDYTRATADSAKEVGEEQVFGPARAAFDDLINRTIIPELGAQFLQMKTNGPSLRSDDLLANLLKVGLDSGALSPADVQRVLEPLVGFKLGKSEDWANWPWKVIENALAKGWVPDGAPKAEPQPTQDPAQNPDENQPTDPPKNQDPQPAG